MKINEQQRKFFLSFIRGNCSIASKSHNRVKGDRIICIVIADGGEIIEEKYNIFIDDDFERALNLLTNRVINILVEYEDYASN